MRFIIITFLREMQCNSQHHQFRPGFAFSGLPLGLGRSALCAKPLLTSPLLPLEILGQVNPPPIHSVPHRHFLAPTSSSPDDATIDARFDLLLRCFSNDKLFTHNSLYVHFSAAAKFHKPLLRIGYSCSSTSVKENFCRSMYYSLSSLGIVSTAFHLFFREFSIWHWFQFIRAFS